MTYPAVDELPETATSTLLGVCAQLSQSRHPGLARWAAAASDALLGRLVTVTTGVRVGGPSSKPCRLEALTPAELERLQSLLQAGAEADDDESVVRWYTRMNGLIFADFCRRELEQVAADARRDGVSAG